MNRRLENLLDRETGARWHIIAYSALAAAFIGFACESNGLALRTAQMIATVLGSVIFILMLSLHRGLPRRERRVARMPLSSLRIALITIAIVFVLAFAVRTGAGVVQAAVLNRTLSHTLNNPKKGPDSPEVMGVLTYARESNTRLNPQLVTQVIDSTKNQDGSKAWAAYLAALNYQFNKDNTKPISTAANPRHGGIDIGRAHYEGMHFSDDWVTYNGGHLALVGVRFENVNFDIADTPNGRKFAEALLHSKNGVVTAILY